MLLDIDKLRHGPEFEISEIDIFDGRGRRVQYMVSRNIISVLKEMVSNPEFKGEMAYAPIRLWTTAEMKEQVHWDMRAGRWWWEEQVSVLFMS